MYPGEMDKGKSVKCHPNFPLFFPPLTFLSSLSGSRDGQERAWIPDSFSGVSTTSFGNIFEKEVLSRKHILEPD